MVVILQVSRLFYQLFLECKILETKDAIANGAEEIDMVIAIGKLKAGQYDYVRDEIDKVHSICKESGKILKVIIEIYPLVSFP